ncbi:unnamed protein product, partial [Prorocentrum cordatum]
RRSGQRAAGSTPPPWPGATPARTSCAGQWSARWLSSKTRPNFGMLPRWTSSSSEWTWAQPTFLSPLAPT